MGILSTSSRWLMAAAVAGLVSASSVGSAAAATAQFKTQLLGTFSAPVAVVQPPGAPTDVWVVQKRGQIIVVRSGAAQATKALDIASTVSYDLEQGLLGLAFAPDFAASHLAYVTYTDKANALVLAEYQASGSVLDTSTKRVVLTIPKPYADHNAGTIRFGADGYLYIAVESNFITGLLLPSQPSRFAYPHCEACALTKATRIPAFRTPGSMHNKARSSPATQRTDIATDSEARCYRCFGC
jgi:glucose/arabinose dehydrogenase